MAYSGVLAFPAAAPVDLEPAMNAAAYVCEESPDERLSRMLAASSLGQALLDEARKYVGWRYDAAVELWTPKEKKKRRLFAGYDLRPSQLKCNQLIYQSLFGLGYCTHLEELDEVGVRPAADWYAADEPYGPFQRVPLPDDVSTVQQLEGALAQRKVELWPGDLMIFSPRGSSGHLALYSHQVKLVEGKAERIRFVMFDANDSESYQGFPGHAVGYHLSGKQIGPDRGCKIWRLAQRAEDFDQQWTNYY